MIHKIGWHSHSSREVCEPENIKYHWFERQIYKLKHTRKGYCKWRHLIWNAWETFNSSVNNSIKDSAKSSSVTPTFHQFLTNFHKTVRLIRQYFKVKWLAHGEKWPFRDFNGTFLRVCFYHFQKWNGINEPRLLSHSSLIDKKSAQVASMMIYYALTRKTHRNHFESNNKWESQKQELCIIKTWNMMKEGKCLVVIMSKLFSHDAFLYKITVLIIWRPCTLNKILIFSSLLVYRLWTFKS